MSSGNYQSYEPYDWFGKNRNNIINAFDNKINNKQRQKKIDILKKQLEVLYKQEDDAWNKYRDLCIREEKIK